MVKVSIIVPIYNVEKYLPRCMNSLLHQTLVDVEFILVNDGSPDNCAALCNEYAMQDNRIKVLHKANAGLGFARNSGIELATGEFVAFIDSDDYVGPKMFEMLYNVAKINSSDTVYCGFNRVDENLTVRPVQEVKELTTFNSRDEINNFLVDMVGNEPSATADRKYQMSVWRAIYSKEIIDRYKIKFHSERQFISEDIIFHIDYLQMASKVAFLPDPLYFYCINGVSLSASYRKDRFERYKVLSVELDRKLSLLGLANYRQSVDRLFIGYVRSLIFSLKNYDMTNEERRAVLKEVSSDEFWHKVITRYPCNISPLKYRIATYLITHNCYKFLMLMAKTK
ncbi:glycosyltransferase [Mucilaginibacter calamicampi]|uniref:Glycosyltransferase n=1 Tax=Mucilaginibacter calamicampi TaxID=1302352 RepID=A0ABW2YWP6_9SPHI